MVTCRSPMIGTFSLKNYQAGSYGGRLGRHNGPGTGRNASRETAQLYTVRWLATIQFGAPLTRATEILDTDG